MKKVLSPRIEMFSPFRKPFAEAEAVMVALDVMEYMASENTKIVAKCTPCQCCACR